MVSTNEQDIDERREVHVHPGARHLRVLDPVGAEMSMDV